MDIFGSIAYVFRYIGEQGDDIVVCHLFDFMDPIQFKISLGLDVMKSIIRDNTQFVHRFTGKNLNLDHGLSLYHFSERVAMTSHIRMGLTLTFLKIRIGENSRKMKAALPFRRHKSSIYFF